MKNLFVLLAAVLVVFASCQKDVESVKGLKSTVSLSVQEDLTALKADIERTTEPLYVKGIDVSVNAGQITEQFIFVDVAGSATEMELKNVPIGAGNSVDVTSIPADNTNHPIYFGEMADRSLVSTTQDPAIREGLLNHFATELGVSGTLLPYAIYTGNTLFDVDAGQPNTVSVDLDTQYGRDFGTIVNNSAYKVTVTLTAVNQGGLATNPLTVEFAPYGDNTMVYYWSNETATQGTTGIRIDVRWFDAYGNEIRKNTGWRIVTQAKESYWAQIQITDDNITTEVVKSAFYFEPINEVGGNHTIK